jgi:hypothetical protein
MTTNKQEANTHGDDNQQYQQQLRGIVSSEKQTHMVTTINNINNN